MTMAVRPDLVKYLDYVANMGSACTIEQFDDDWEPIGRMVRAELMPTFLVLVGERLTLTDDGDYARLFSQLKTK